VKVVAWVLIGAIILGIAVNAFSATIMIHGERRQHRKNTEERFALSTHIRVPFD